MPESIESFVQRLQREGVEAGREQAEQTLAKARAESERLLEEARAKVLKIQEEAERQARETLRRGKDELQLAVRDTLLALRERIVGGLGKLLQDAVGESLRDPEFLGGLIRDVVGRYAQGDASGARRLELKLEDAALEALSTRALADLVDEGRVGLSGALKSAGFEYSVAGGKVEVTAASVGAILADLAGPRLRESIDRALAPDA